MIVRSHASGWCPAGKGVWLVALTAILTACVSVPPPGIGEPVSWSDLPGWRDDRPAEAWPALEKSCERLPARDARWREICADASLFPQPDDATARAFFETRFEPYVVHGDRGRKHDGLITGYYEPLLHGSLKRSARFRYPVHGVPEDLLVVDLGALYPELKGKPLRGRLDGRRVVPYFSRTEIGVAKKLAAPVIVWVDDPVALFFLQVQGSGRVQIEDGALLFVGYADQNGHPYFAIGNTLVARAALKPEEVNLESIRAWLVANPGAAAEVLNSNPSYIFFARREQPAIGALAVPLTPQRSVAVDPAFIPLGVPLWLDTTLPDTAPFRRLVFAQDTGGAIKGPVRADVFFGFGPEAERLAGNMKSPGRVFVLLPATRLIDK
ncbi:MAG: murein transglycosylase A [Gammaproteobacteria bacterium]|nr:murein transglycosylase A [Gammaproteobacteria bacterium]